MGTTTSNNAGAMGAVPPAAGVPAKAPAATGVAPHALPDEPLVTIEPGKSWAGLDLRELWEYRELLYFLIWRDVKVRYKQAALGLAWVLIQPLLMTAVFTIFLGKLARVPSDGTPYMLFAYIGLLIWGFFSSSVMNSSASLVGNAHLITKVYFPRGVVPAAAVGARLVDLAVSSLLLVGLLVYYRVAPTAALLALPPLLVMTTLLALACGMLTSSLNVKYRDMGVALPVLMQLWMYLSPVLYPLSLVPEGWRGVYALNPLVGIVSGFRAAVLGGEFDWYALAVSASFTLALLVCASYLFRRVEREFADVI
ncbi:MAG TPA: ABC transporter permease [Pyrinomonadaceae bacterium]|nr:ABC transporter permease [Pyrinomonadaceae bacterium]